MLKRQLVLEDGTVFTGGGFGSGTEHMGEVIFHSGMTGYQEVISIAERFQQLGFQLYATTGTATTLQYHGIPVKTVGKIDAGVPGVSSVIQSGAVKAVINTLISSTRPHSDGFRIRRASVEHGIACFTNLDTANAILRVIDSTTFSAQPLTGKEVLLP